jgi:peptide deformylase
LIYDIVTYGKPVLRERAAKVEKVDDNIRQLVKDMLDTMYANNGLGLAAEQVGHNESICVIDMPPESESSGIEVSQLNKDVILPLIMINPEIVELTGEQTGQEGCLSFPDVFVTVKRAMEVTVRFLDLENREVTVKADGLLSRAIQHEVDHLNGILLVDKMSTVQKVAVSGKLKRLKKANKE